MAKAPRLPRETYLVTWVWAENPDQTNQETVQATTAPRAINKAIKLVSEEYAEARTEMRVLDAVRCRS